MPVELVDVMAGDIMLRCTLLLKEGHLWGRRQVIHPVRKSADGPSPRLL